MSKFVKWLSTFNYLTYVSFRSKFMYNKRVFFQILQSIFSLFAFIYVWYSLDASGNNTSGTDLKGLVTYSVISTLLSVCLPIDIISKLFEQDISNGDVGHKLLRPISIGSTFLASALGTMAASFIVKALPILAFALVFNKIDIPKSLSIWSLFISSILLGIVVTLLLDLVTAYLCFWIFRGTHVRHFIEAIFTAFSGRLIPLTLLPTFFMEVSYFLPGRSVYYDPISIFIGAMHKEEYLQLFGRLGLWIVILGALAHLLKRASMKRVFVQGG